MLSAFFVPAGANHFANPGFYIPMMPPWLPAHRELIWLSGVLEVLVRQPFQRMTVAVERSTG